MGAHLDDRGAGRADSGLDQLERHLLGDQLVQPVDEARRTARSEHPAVEHRVRVDVVQDVDERRGHVLRQHHEGTSRDQADQAGQLVLHGVEQQLVEVAVVLMDRRAIDGGPLGDVGDGEGPGLVLGGEVQDGGPQQGAGPLHPGIDALGHLRSLHRLGDRCRGLGSVQRPPRPAAGILRRQAAPEAHRDGPYALCGHGAGVVVTAVAWVPSSVSPRRTDRRTDRRARPGRRGAAA
ncbi:hypothetical protein [Streptomyces sp. NPDC088256]|uniref:hypothetical protein n=1 Tax=Streptomyces sp. NPDC088256 TaxID=3365848 RepID=UPI0037FCFE63